MRRPVRSPAARLGLFAGILALCCSALAAEVYTWTDEDGVVHFGDSPPASGEARAIEAEEAYRPGTTGVYGTEPGAETTNSPGSPESPAQARREAIRARGEEQRESREETEQLCDRHRQRLEQMEPARRVFYVNEAGEEVRMDDEQRLELIEEDKDFLAKNCR